MTARALVVAVPKTRVRALPDLPSVTGDAEEVTGRLRTRGFDVVACPHGLTVNEFASKLLELRAATKPGDLGLLYFSGHGYRLPDHDGDEWDDSWDECLVLSDGLLRDDWFRESFWPRTAAHTKWVTCADSCFSATAMRWLGPDPPSIPIKAVEPRQGSWRIDLAAAPDGEKALQLTDKSHGFGRAMAWMTARLLEHLHDAPDATYRSTWAAIERQAREYRLGGVQVPIPQLRHSATDDALLDSTALAALDW